MKSEFEKPEKNQEFRGTGPDLRVKAPKIHHLNCGLLHAPPNPKASCHCLLLEGQGKLALVDTGIGLQDIARPTERVGQFAIDAMGFQFEESLTAIRQLEELGFRADEVTDIVLTHCDADHVGGLADFPDAKVHLSREEYSEVEAGSPRYSLPQFSHGPHWKIYGPSEERWFGLERRELELFEGTEIFLIPLFGHTKGHCGVAIQEGDRWALHVGDTYYIRGELLDSGHPVSAVSASSAVDNEQRLRSLQELRRLFEEHSPDIELFGYHDFQEFP